MKNTIGPSHPVSQAIHKLKYRLEGETFEDAMARIAGALRDDDEHFRSLYNILLEMRFLPGGRVQAAIGAPRKVTAFNCFVSGPIPDSMDGIMGRAGEAAQTMRLGGGIGYDFSTIRPDGSLIESLDTRASGPVSFMGIFDAVCKTIASAGHRRGAQMAVLRVDHPDIIKFITAKHNNHNLTQFNVSIGATDAFMSAVQRKEPFTLSWNGRAYQTVDANYLWELALRSTWDWAEPGVLFLDTINKKNNLWYCETITATNPCAEQPLPPYGSCLLGSFNMVKYIDPENKVFLYEKFKRDIYPVVRAMDNIIDRTIYPLFEQESEAKNKRRMGLGVTGLANALEILGYPYGSPEFLSEMKKILETLRDTAYLSSVSLAVEKGSFPMFDPHLYTTSGFMQTMPEDIIKTIKQFGIRNSHLLSIAPTGTISLTADNISSGIEPVFSYGYERLVQLPEGPKVMDVSDYAFANFGVKGRKADDISVEEHVDVLNLASRYVDSSVSKTCNVGPSVSWDRFKDVYMRAYNGGASGCTTFRLDGKRFGILIDKKADDDPQKAGEACYFDPETGRKTCE